MSNVEEIVASDNALVAIVDLDSRVSIWDMRLGKKTSEFQSFWDIGGRRLAISSDGALCAVGAFNRYGVTLHETSSGKILWQKKSLKKVQRLKFSRHIDALLAELDLRSFHVLNPRTGEIIEKMPGVEFVYESPFGPLVMLDRKSRPFELVESHSHKKIANIPRTSFALISAYFTETSVILWESGNYPKIRPSISCRSLHDGGLVWRFTTPNDFEPCNMGYRKDSEELLVVKNYDALLALGKEDGKIKREVPIDNAGRAEFVLDGTRLVTWTGRILDTMTGETVSSLSFPLGSSQLNGNRFLATERS